MNEWVIRSDEPDGITILTLNRPEAANALSKALLEAFLDHLTEIQRDDSIRCLILTGAGEKAFCAGADLKERKGMDNAQVVEAVERIRRAVEAVAALPIPVIAVLNGVAFGGGAELAMAADLRILGERAKVGLTETSLAIIPGAGGTQRLPRLVGVAKAKELIYTAERIDATVALDIGFANQVVPNEKLMDAAFAMARKIANNGPVAIRQAKFAIDEGLQSDLQSGLQIEIQAYAGVIDTMDRQEGLNAFAQKRQPRYQGK